MSSETELSISFASIHAKINALITALSEEQRVVFDNELERIKRKASEKFNPENNQRLHSVIEESFRVKPSR